MHNYKAFHSIKQHHSAEHNQEKTVKMRNQLPEAYLTEGSRLYIGHTPTPRGCACRILHHNGGIGVAPVIPVETTRQQIPGLHVFVHQHDISLISLNSI